MTAFDTARTTIKTFSSAACPQTKTNQATDGASHYKYRSGETPLGANGFCSAEDMKKKQFARPRSFDL
jgi:hypothetical protein